MRKLVEKLKVGGFIARVLFPSPRTVCRLSASIALLAPLRSFADGGTGSHAVVDLRMEHGWMVEGPGNFQPSALAECDGTLLTVADKHSDTIFRFEFAGDGAVAKCVPHVTFTGPNPLPPNGWLDLEALVVAPDGTFFLSSEEANRLLTVPAKGGEATWITPDLGPIGAEAGLFAVHNAYGEGLAMLGPGRFLVGAERDPRGVIELKIGGPEAVASASAQRMMASRFPIPPGRGADFSDLCTWHGRVFALARNQHLVVELIRDASGSWSEGPTAYSYLGAETDPAWSYASTRWGLAEGLTIGDERIYIVVDNNGAARTGSPDDKRPCLWAFRNPIAR